MPKTNDQSKTSTSLRPMRRVFRLVTSAVFALIALWVGMSIPSYFRSVAPVVLEAAGKDSPQLPEIARQFINEARLGSAQPIISIIEDSVEKKDLLNRYADILHREPSLRFSGSNDPYYDQFLALAPYLDQSRPQVIRTLLPPENRKVLLGFLSESLNNNVQSVLKTREWTDWRVFLPVFSKAGQPLDATILTTALLEQASAFSPQLREQLRRILDNPNAGDGVSQQSLEDIESIYAALLSLGKQLDWSQLKTVVGKTATISDLLFASTIAKDSPEKLNLFLSALLVSQNPEQLYSYLKTYPDRGWHGVDVALHSGIAALDTLYELDNPPFDPPAFWKALPQEFTSLQSSFMGFAAEYPQFSLFLRALAFALCGYFLVNFLRAIFMPRPPRNDKKRFLINLDAIIGGLLVMFFIWVIIEPELLHFRPNEQGELTLNLASFLPESTTETEKPNSAMIDQVTIIVLAIFFVLQLLVFIFSLIKISEIRKQSVSPELKLRLLDNEETLFELGLYVGLGGTVFSLIMVVLKFVDASLMAAYASTLFGIIFVALLKIGFLRPFRRGLILAKPGDDAPNTDRNEPLAP